jgi:hypothetical protein
MDVKLIIDILGWTGSVAVIVAYALNSYGKLKPDSFIFQMLNLVGAIFLIANTIYLKSYPSTFINVVWLIIASSALLKMAFKKK